MHIAAAAPHYIRPEEVPREVLEQEKEKYRDQAEAEGKPSHVIDRIVEGRLKKFCKETCLLSQPYVKAPELTIEDLLGELASKVRARRWSSRGLPASKLELVVLDDNFLRTSGDGKSPLVIRNLGPADGEGIQVRGGV